LLSQATWAQVAAQWGLNTALLANPITWIVVGIMALIAAFVAAWNYSEKFRGAILGIWEVIKGFGNILKDFVIDRITGILKGLGGIASAIGKLFKRDFKGALQEGKDALINLSGANAMKNAIDNGKKLGDKFKSGYQKGIDGFAKDKTEAGYVKDEKTGEWVKSKTENKAEMAIPSMPEMPASAMPSSDIDALLKKLNQGKNKKKDQKDDTLALGIPQNYSQTNAYSVIASKFGTPTVSIDSATEKPVISMATHVEEIAGSLRKIAAITALPVMMTLGAANISKAEKLMPVANTQHNINTTEVNAPVSHSNKLESVYNAFDNRLYQSSHQITDLSKSVNHVNNEATNVADNRLYEANQQITDFSQKVNRSDFDNRLYQSSQQITDLSKSVNHVNNEATNVSDNRLYEANQQITDLSQKVNSSNFDNRLYQSSQQITDLSQKVNHITNTANHEENNLLSNVTESANNYTSSANSLTADNSTNSLNNDNSQNHTTNNQGKTVHFDRFTDKIEIHVSGVDSPRLAADQVRNEVEKALAEILNV